MTLESEQPMNLEKIKRLADWIDNEPTLITGIDHTIAPVLKALIASLEEIRELIDHPSVLDDIITRNLEPLK